MKKRLVVSLLVIALLSLVVMPALAFSSIQFLVRDSLTQSPWGTTSGQSYRIFVLGSSSGTLLDTGTLTTPASPVLDFTCAYGAACPPGSGTTLTAPAVAETVTVFIILTGTANNPPTIVKSYTQPPIDLGTFTINEQTGTGPTAIALQSFAASNPTVAITSVTLLLLVLAGATLVVLQRRQSLAA